MTSFMIDYYLDPYFVRFVPLKSKINTSVNKSIELNSGQLQVMLKDCCNGDLACTN